MVVLISTQSQKKRTMNNTFRPIYYLGCKSQLIKPIAAAIEYIDPGKGRLLDLFAGSGAVGQALCKEREVTTADIQEYSRILCSAVMNPALPDNVSVEQIIQHIHSSEILANLTWCLQPLIDHEKDCMTSALQGAPKHLAELVQSPPLTLLAVEKSSLPCATKLQEQIQITIERLTEKKLINSALSTVCRYFGGVYYSYHQAAYFDAALYFADNYSGAPRDTLKAAILSTASQLVNTVGKQFAQPIRPADKTGSIKKGFVKAACKDRSLEVLTSYQSWIEKYAKLEVAPKKNKALAQDFRSAIIDEGGSVSAVYADPPYTRDHYSRFYHVLETMSLRDNPEISTVKKDGLEQASRGVYRKNRYQSEFCIRSQAPSAFEDLFKLTSDRNLPLVLSYSPHEAGDGTHPRVVATNQIVELANKYFSKVEIDTIEGAFHNQFNKIEFNLKNRQHAEILLKCHV